MKSLSLIIALLFSSTTFSQDFSLYLHTKGNLNGSTLLNSSITSNESQNYSFALSGNGGIGASFIYDDKIGVSLELLVGNHKANYSGNYLNGLIESTYSSQINLQVIQFPILFRLEHDDGYLEIGPQFNILSNAKYSSNLLEFQEYNVTDAYKKTNFSGVLGFGSYNTLGGKRSPLSLSFGFRINYGLMDVKGVDPEGVYYMDIPNSNKSVMLAGGVNLGLHYELK